MGRKMPKYQQSSRTALRHPTNLNGAGIATEQDTALAKLRERSPAQPGARNVTHVGRRVTTKLVVRVARNSPPPQPTMRSQKVRLCPWEHSPASWRPWPP